jgi:ferric-dicitrate binding protein FerR (iron transport regulator)
MMDEIKLGKLLSGELSSEELKDTELWLKDPGNKLEFERLSQLWDASSELKEAALFEADRSWTKMKKRMDQGKQRSIHKFNLSIIKYGVAASILVIFGLAAFYFIQNNRSRQLVHITAGDEKLIKPVKLPDGTTVYLNRNTNLTYSRNFNGDTRTVSLTGEAFFDVTKDPSRPFIIRTASAEIKVVGTSFNVMAYSGSDSVQVQVQSGVVELYSKTERDTKLRLTVGNEGTLVKSNQKLQSQPVFDSNTLAWKTNKLNFRNADMSYVTSVLEHAFGKEIQFNAKAFRNCRLTVNFSNQSFDTVMKVIKETFGVNIVNNGDVYILSGPGC